MRKFKELSAVKIRIMPLICLQIGLIFLTTAVPSVGVADPAPGTPGDSGDQNPHGAPPGQGGEIPGNSGDNNPHESPPGQRIETPDVDPATPVNPSSLPVVESVFLIKGFAEGVGILGRSGVKAEKVTENDIRKLAMYLDQIKGGEATWRDIVCRFGSVSVKAFSEMNVGGSKYTLETVLFKDGDLEHGYERGEPANYREWIRKPPTLYEKFGTGPWSESKAIKGAEPTTYSVNGTRISWPMGAADISVDKTAAGQRIVYIRRMDGTFLEWEVESGSCYVRKIRGYDTNRHLEWEETRNLEMRDGIAVILSRTVRYYTLPAGELKETCEWSDGKSLGVLSVVGLMR